MPDELDSIRQKLARVYWLGGSPCSGKSSIADSLVERYSLRLYRCDDAFYRHDKRTTPEEQPVFYRVMRLSPEDLWMRPVGQQVAEEIEIYHEEFPMILRDLVEMADGFDDRPILAEGAALLPELVAPLLGSADGGTGRQSRAIWVVPTAEFQRYHYARREWTSQVVKDCKNPAQAFENWMERDIRFAEYARGEALQRGLPVLLVDGSATIAENIQVVEKHLNLTPFL